MAHDVFISYSSKDKPSADAVCAVLESNEIRCWIAPRDISPGQDWGEGILDGLKAARVFVLVFSANANASPQIKREVERAVSLGIPIIPMRIEDVSPTRSLEYYISTPHWLDAFTPPFEQHLNYLASVVRSLLNGAVKPVQAHPQPRGRAQRWGISLSLGLRSWRLAFTLSVGALSVAFAVFLVPELSVLSLTREPSAWQPAMKAETLSPSRRTDRLPSDSQEVEMAYWDAIRTGDDPDLFEAYLAKFPGGRFSQAAHMRLEELKNEAERARLVSLKKGAREQAQLAKVETDTVQARSMPARSREASPRRSSSGAYPAGPASENFSGIWRSSAGTGVAEFGGGHFMHYRTTFSDLRLTLDVDGDNRPIDGNAVGTATEIAAEKPIGAASSSQYSFTLTSGEISGKTVTLEFRGASSNYPPANAHFAGAVGVDGKISGTLQIARINDGVVPEVLWTIAVPLVLARQ